MSLIIGVHLIVRHEEDRIIECLESCKGLADFFSIAVDSREDSDKTYELCCDYVRNNIGEHAVKGVFRDEWKDSFSIARNNALTNLISLLEENSTPDDLVYIVWVDSDDLSSPDSISHKEIRQRLEALQPDSVRNKYIYAFDYSVDPPKSSLEYYRTRAWKHQYKQPPVFEWRGPAHEVEVKLRSITNVDLTWNDWILLHRKAGNESHREGRTDRNIRIFEKAISEEPENARYRFYLGREYKDAGKFAQSIVSMQKYLSLSQFPAEKYQALMDIANMYKWLGDLESSEKTAKQALEFKPEIAEAAVLLGEICTQKSQWGLARSWFAYAIHAPHGEVLFDHIAIRTYVCRRWMAIACHYSNMPEEAKYYHAIAKKMAPKDSLIRFNDPWLHENSNDYCPETLISFFEALDDRYHKVIEDKDPPSIFVSLFAQLVDSLVFKGGEAVIEIGPGTSKDTIRIATFNPQSPVFILDAFDDGEKEKEIIEEVDTLMNMTLIKSVTSQILEGKAFGEGWLKEKVKVVLCTTSFSNVSMMSSLISFLSEPSVIIIDNFQLNEVKVSTGKLLQSFNRFTLIRRYDFENHEIAVVVYV
jgi:tetratricopeptide (TPR) repeat protein